MKRIVLLILIFAVCFNCKKEQVLENKDVGEKLRIKNETPYQIESALIRMGNSENIYSAINSNEISDYKSFNETINPYIKLKINNKDVEFDIRPTEAPPSGTSYVSAKPMTCVITYSNALGSFDLHFIE